MGRACVHIRTCALAYTYSWNMEKKIIIFWKRIFIIKSGWLINFSHYEFFSDFLSWDTHGLLSLVFSARLIPHVIIRKSFKVSEVSFSVMFSLLWDLRSLSQQGRTISPVDSKVSLITSLLIHSKLYSVAFFSYLFSVSLGCVKAFWQLFKQDHLSTVSEGKFH